MEQLKLGLITFVLLAAFLVSFTVITLKIFVSKKDKEDDEDE